MISPGNRLRLIELPRLPAAAVEHRRDQADEVFLHAAIGGGLRLGSALRIVLFAQEPDVVLSRFTLLRGHVRSLRKTRSDDHGGAPQNPR